MRKVIILPFIALLGAATAGLGQDLEIHFVDVGQGDCTLVMCPNGKKILVDCGSGSNCTNVSASSYVRGLLDGELDALVLTHADTDHYGILQQVLKGITPAQIMRVDGPRNEYKSCGFEKWLERQEDTLHTPAEGLPVDFHNSKDNPNTTLDCGEAEIFVLAANVQSSFSQKNTESIVLLLSYENFDAILTGDATRITEDKILKFHEDEWLRSEVYKIPHHGSSTTSKDQALGVAAQPLLAMTSNGFRNSYGHPRKKAIQKLLPFLAEAPSHQIRWCTSQSSCRKEMVDVHFYTTATSGTIIVGSDGKSYWITQRRELVIE